MKSLLSEYPALFAEKLGGEPRIRAAIDSSLAIVTDILQVSKLPFFPDYTGHGTRHLTSVIEIAEKLIPERSRPLLTAEDAAVLIFSVLLHDLALHLSEAGFMSLLNPAESTCESDEWKELWRDFLAVAKHWDDHKLIELFGADEDGAPSGIIRNPLDYYENLTENDRKLIGEFIRQHHARMAYQFGIRGFPGHDGQLIQFGSLDPELKELAAIVAKSHGLPLRDSVGFLEEKQFNRLEHSNVHPIFLMGILRVADFLELGKDRAPLIAFAYKKFKSPLSRREWLTNQAFRKISWGNPDPESIHIPATPTDVHSFLELERWLRAIQSELDTTWAVLGEIYQGHPTFSGFGLAIRRVRSNIIDNPKTFSKSASFVPRRVELGVADAEVLKLFIDPLYGEHPEVGIRELIQNAVDAVRERRQFEENHPNLLLPETAPEADVIAWLGDPDENGTALLSVTDNGIGMTEEVVANYFLKAGASFRRSIDWKKEFEFDDSVSSKTHLKSRVLRSGRFGIGVLAAFLLGDEIEVSTRHVKSARGIQFSVRLDLRPAFESTLIQLNYDTSLPIGTTVKVKVNKVTLAKVEKMGRYTTFIGSDIFSDPNLWDWYCLKSPSVLRLRGPEKKILKQSVMVPAEDCTLSRGWHSLPSSEYRTVHVLTCGTSATYAPRLVCNGIKVTQMRTSTELFRNDPLVIDLTRSLFPSQGLFRLCTPSFSIHDPDGTLPLNLQRSGITNLRLDFLPAAFLAQAKSVLAKFLLAAPFEPDVTESFWKGLTEGLVFDQAIPVFLTKTGTAPLTARNLEFAQVRHCLLLSVECFTQGWLAHLRNRYDAVIIARSGYHRTSPIYSLNELNPWIACARVITRSNEEPVVKKPLRFRYKEFSVDGLHVYRTANCSSSLFKCEDIEILRNQLREGQNHSNLESTDAFIGAELFLKKEPLFEAQSSLSFANCWKQIILEPTIPFDLAERQIKLKHAYEALHEYLYDDQDPLTSVQ